MAERLLQNGEIIVTPKSFRTTITLPTELETFVVTRAAQAKYLRFGESVNVSAYIRDLILQDKFFFDKHFKPARQLAERIRALRAKKGGRK